MGNTVVLDKVSQRNKQLEMYIYLWRCISKEIYYKGLAHVIMEAKKSQSLQ